MNQKNSLGLNNCFLDLDDPNSEISRKINTRKHKTLAPEAGTDPKIYYLI